MKLVYSDDFSRSPILLLKSIVGHPRKSSEYFCTASSWKLSCIESLTRLIILEVFVKAGSGGAGSSAVKFGKARQVLTSDLTITYTLRTISIPHQNSPDWLSHSLILTNQQHVAPSGGSGGDGGNVIFTVDPSFNTLLGFRGRSNFKAEHGAEGNPKYRLYLLWNKSFCLLRHNSLFCSPLWSYGVCSTMFSDESYFSKAYSHIRLQISSPCFFRIISWSFSFLLCIPSTLILITIISYLKNPSVLAYIAHLNIAHSYHNNSS